METRYTNYHYSRAIVSKANAHQAQANEQPTDIDVPIQIYVDSLIYCTFRCAMKAIFLTKISH